MSVPASPPQQPKLAVSHLARSASKWMFLSYRCVRVIFTSLILRGDSPMRKLVVLFSFMTFALAAFAGDDLDQYKGKAITVVFAAGKKTRENAIEQIQGMVGNPVK